MFNSRVNSRANPPATSATEVEVLFASLAPTGPEFSQKKMFGYLCCFVNGNLFAGLHKRNMIFRLPAGDRRCSSSSKGRRLSSPGRAAACRHT